MNRRKFLATLFGAGAAIAAGPALLSLVPTPMPAAPLGIGGWSQGETFLVGDTFTIEMMDRYIQPAAQALLAEYERRMVQHFTVTAAVTSEAA